MTPFVHLSYIRVREAKGRALSTNSTHSGASERRTPVGGSANAPSRALPNEQHKRTETHRLFSPASLRMCGFRLGIRPYQRPISIRRQEQDVEGSGTPQLFEDAIEPGYNLLRNFYLVHRANLSLSCDATANDGQRRSCRDSTNRSRPLSLLDRSPPHTHASGRSQ